MPLSKASQGVERRTLLVGIRRKVHAPTVTPQLSRPLPPRPPQRSLSLSRLLDSKGTRASVRPGTVVGAAARRQPSDGYR